MSESVIIAGAGPCGLLLAGELALAGVHPIVVERRAEPAAASQSMSVHARSIELLAQRGLAERIQKDEMFLWPRTPFSMLWLDLNTVTEIDHTYVYHQWRLERLLDRRAGELGVEIRRGAEIIGYAQDDDGVTVTIRTGDSVETLRGAYLVGCDGQRSTVRELAGIAVRGEGPGWYGVFADVPVAEAKDHMFDAGVYPAGLFGAMPIAKDFLRLMTVEFDAKAPAPEAPVTLDELQASMRRVLGKEVAISETLWTSRFEGATRLAERYRDGRVFLAGDAAHSLFFSGTAGLNAALQDAVNLGWKLAGTLNGWAPADLLDTYAEERRPVGERVCLHADAVLGLMYPLSHVRELRVIVDELLKYEEVSRHLLRMPTAARYPMDAESAAEDDSLTGTHVPDLKITTAGQVGSILQTLHGGHAVLLDVCGGEAAAVVAPGEWNGRLEVVTVTAPVDGLDAGHLLIRPDGYVAYTGSDVDAGALRAAITRWLGDPET